MALPGALCLAGCQGAQSLIDPAGPSAAAIAAVWWWMLGAATLVFLGVLLLWGWALRRRPGAPDTGPSGRAWLIGGGVLLPSAAIGLLLVFGSSSGLHQLPLSWGQAEGAGPAPLRIEITGHQWHWRVRYPDGGPTLRNELRIPVGRPLDIEVLSADVIHSFWVPRLGGKIDAIPGRRNRIRLQADVPGEFRSPCAEFCGLAHAHMLMSVHAMPPEAFEAWMADNGTRRDD